MALVRAREPELDFGGGLELPLGSDSINQRVGGSGSERFEGAGPGWGTGGSSSGDPFASSSAGQSSPGSISFQTPTRPSPSGSTLPSAASTKRAKSVRTKTPAKLVKMGLFTNSPDPYPASPALPASPLSPSRLSLKHNASSSSLATATGVPLPVSPASVKRRVSLLGVPIQLPTLRRAKSEKRLRCRSMVAVGLDGEGHRVLTRRTSFPSLRKAREVRSCSDPGHGRCEAGCGGEGSEDEGEGARTPPVPVRRSKRCFGIGEGELSDEEEELSSVGHGIGMGRASSSGHGHGPGSSAPHSYAMEGGASSYSSYSSIESTESHASNWSSSTDATSTGSGSPTISLIASTPTKPLLDAPWLTQPGRGSALTWAAEPEELRTRESPSPPIAKHQSWDPPGTARLGAPFGQRSASLPSQPPIGYDPYLQPIRNCHLDTPPAAEPGPCERNPYLTSLNYPAPQPHRYTISAFHYQPAAQPASSSISQRLLRRRSAPLQGSQPSLPPGAEAPLPAPAAVAQENRLRAASADGAPTSSPGKGAGMSRLLRRASASLTGAGGRPLSVVQAASGPAAGNALGLGGQEGQLMSPVREKRVRSKSSGYGIGLEVVKEDVDGWTPGVMAPWATYGTLKIANPDPPSPASSRVASPTPAASSGGTLSEGLELYEWSETALLTSSESDEDGEADETFVTSREGREEEEESIGCAF